MLPHVPLVETHTYLHDTGQEQKYTDNKKSNSNQPRTWL